MSHNRKVFYVFLTMVAIFFTPYIALYLETNGKIPEGFFDFPAKEARIKPGINYVAVGIAAVLMLAFLLLLIFPRLYGFKKVRAIPKNVKKEKLPIWFWVGLVMLSIILILFIGKYEKPKWLMDWALLPLWWGFILMLDGLVFVRNEGKSLVKNAMPELIAMATLSISGWLIFEYFNLFIRLNWYYPAADLMSHRGFLLYAAIGSSAFIPMAFEWYHLLRTFSWLDSRYKHGARLEYSKGTKISLFILAFIMLYAMVHYYDKMFYAVWFSPLAIMIIAMNLLGQWTPFTPIKNGDWSTVVLFGLTWVLQGFCVEWWNALSYSDPALFPDTYNPGYWEYCLPYVHFGCIFNMPFLGYLGYVPFGIYCCMWVVTMSFLMNIHLPFSLKEKYE